MFENNTICQACLSKERKLFPLQKFYQLLKILKLSKLINIKGNICWECKSLITKYYNFKVQVHTAQNTLTHIEKVNDLKCLSKLNFNKCTYDNIEHIYNYDPLTSNNPDLTIEYEQEIEAIKQEDDNNYDDEKSDLYALECNNDSLEHTNNVPVKITNNTGGVDVLNDVSSKIITDGFVTEACEFTKEGNDLQSATINSHEENNEFILVCPFKDEFNTKNKFKASILTEDQMLEYREKMINNPKFRKSVFKCDMCIKVFSNEKAINDHQVNNHREGGASYNKCDICHLSFVTPQRAKEHRKIHYLLYKCIFCEYEHNEMWTIWQHCKIKHAYQYVDSMEPMELNEDAVEPVKKQYLESIQRSVEHVCVCGHKCATPRMLYKHRRSCRKYFKYTCERCGKKFRYPHILTRHELVHEGMPVTKCEVCNKEYRGPWGLKAHMKTHVDPNKVDEQAYCAECNIYFKNRYVYRTHLRTNLKHVDKDDMKYACPHCDRRFTVKNYLKRHILSHGDTKNFVCQTCSLAFKTPQYLRKHVREKHEHREQPRNKVCDICGRAFKSKQTLQQHLNSHTGERPYECVLCGANFGYSGALHTHVKLKHKMIKRIRRTQGPGKQREQ